jgi:formamidopyrimidine-DNA glycosylase
VHFRLDGDWELGRAATLLPRHTRVTFDLEAGRRACLTDPRALCTVTWHAPGAPPELTLGPEPEEPSLTATALRERLGRKRGPIKPSLLDQRLLAGVGNIYAGEACWHARIHPGARADALSLTRVARLLDGLRVALADGHTNAGRYHRGERLIPFQVYDREGAPCGRCGAAVRRIVQAGRGTWFCPRCQRR